MPKHVADRTFCIPGVEEGTATLTRKTYKCVMKAVEELVSAVHPNFKPGEKKIRKWSPAKEDLRFGQ